MGSRKAQNISYKQFLTSSVDISSNKLAIGQFQRNYVWTGKHVKSLIESIDSNDNGFFLGNLVIQRSDRGNSGRDYVVDGQQRLVTLSLTVKALGNLLPSAAPGKSCDNILFFSARNPRIKFARPNLERAYRTLLRDTSFPNPCDANQLRLQTAFKKVQKELKNLPDLPGFLNKVRKLEFVVIKCPSTQDVHQLFEGLNSKGQKLSPVELTKNLLLAESSLATTLLNRTNRKWETIEQLFEESESRLVWFSKFLRHYWFSLKGYVSEKNLFDGIRSHVRAEGVELFTDEILKYSRIYIAFRRSDLTKRGFSSTMSDTAWRKIDLLISCVKELQLDQIYAVLLALYIRGQTHSEYFERERLFKDIEKLWCFLVLIKFSNASPASYERLFADFCFGVNHETNFKLIKRTFFQKLLTKIPTKEEFVNELNVRIKCTGEMSSRVDYRNHTGVIRTLLLMYLSDGEELLGDFTIEHIIPKGSLLNWKNISPTYIAQVTSSERYKLGNLTLLRNDDVENANFNKKHKLAYSSSRFEKNQELDNYAATFNSVNPTRAVTSRGRDVAGDIYDICVRKLKSAI